MRRLLFSLLVASGVVAAAPLVAPSGASVYGRTIWVQRPPAAAAWWSGAWGAWDLAGAASAQAALLDITDQGRPLVAYGGSWGAGLGWAVGGAAVLDTQYVAASSDVSVLVRVDSCPVQSGQVIMGANAASPSRWTVSVYGSGSQSGFAHGTSLSPLVASVTSGVWGVGPGYGIRSGSVVATWTQAGATAPYSVYIGASHSPGGVAAQIPAGCRVRAAAIWSPGLSPTDAAARAAAMP